jgi:hypothetical protein
MARTKGTTVPGFEVEKNLWERFQTWADRHRWSYRDSSEMAFEFLMRCPPSLLEFVVAADWRAVEEYFRQADKARAGAAVVSGVESQAVQDQQKAPPARRESSGGKAQ